TSRSDAAIRSAFTAPTHQTPPAPPRPPLPFRRSMTGDATEPATFQACRPARRPTSPGQAQARARSRQAHRSTQRRCLGEYRADRSQDRVHLDRQARCHPEPATEPDMADEDADVEQRLPRRPRIGETAEHDEIRVTRDDRATQAVEFGGEP